MQKIITLIITAAIIYLIMQQNIGTSTPVQIQPQNTQEPKEKKTQNPPEISGSFIEKTLSSVLVNVLKTDEGRLVIENMLQPMSKSSSGANGWYAMNNDSFLSSIFKISTFGIGEEGPASCGQVVTAHYKILSDDNIVLEDKVATFPLGSGKTPPGMDAIIVGMQTGQTRHATITNKYIQNTTKDKISSFKINVLLKSIIPKNFMGENVKIYDDHLAYRIPLVCGNKAIYDAKITKLSTGEVLYNSVDSGKKINMIIGNLNYPAIFSHALHNNIPVGTRTVIAPGRFFKSYISDHSIIFPNKKLPQNELFMVEFFNFDESTMTDHVTFSR